MIQGQSICRTSIKPSTQEEAPESGVQGHLWLYREFENSLSYVIPCLRKKGWEGRRQTDRQRQREIDRETEGKFSIFNWFK